LTNSGSWCTPAGEFSTSPGLGSRNAPSSRSTPRCRRPRRYTWRSDGSTTTGHTGRVSNCDVTEVVLAVITVRCATGCVSRGESALRPRQCGRWRRCRSTSNKHSALSGPGQRSPFSAVSVALRFWEGNAFVAAVAKSPTGHRNPSDVGHLVLIPHQPTPVGFLRRRLHAMGMRVATGFCRRGCSILITTRAGAQSQMYVAGATLLETYAVPPLLNPQCWPSAVRLTTACCIAAVNARIGRDERRRRTTGCYGRSAR